MFQNINNRPNFFNFPLIIQFFILWILFSVASYIIKDLLLVALVTADNNRIGNELISLQEVHNTGAAFNLFSAHPQALIIVSIAAVIIITLTIIFFSSRLSKSVIPSLAILNSGITLNLYERITQGYVIDYIHLEFIKNCPVFNISDILIIVGAFGIISAIFTRE